MDTSLQILDSVAGILIFLAIVPALWIAGRIVLKNRLGDHRTQLFLWLVLGGFFLIPLVDLISYLRDLISLAIPSDQNVTNFPLFLGTSSWLIYSVIAITMGVIVYSFAIYYGGRIIENRRFPILKELTLNSLEKGFILLGVAGLFHQMIRGIVINFIWMRLPVSQYVSSQGLIGSLVGWIIAFLLLAIAIISMSGKLQGEQD
jgi:hypothetical protein